LSNMIAEILATGDEIRSGALIDSNSAHIAQQLEEAGVEVIRHSCTGDDLDVLASILREIGDRSDIAVVTGGLGPTADDLSAEAAATAAGVDLVLDNKALGWVEEAFEKRKWPMSESNKKQAVLPEGAEPLYNPVGTAPGFLLKIGRCSFFFLPGVPFEMRRMISDTVLPRLIKMQGNHREFHLSRTITTFGLGEASTNERLAGLTERFPGIKLGLRAKFPEIHIKFYVCGNDEGVLKKMMEEGAEWIAQKMGNNVISPQGASMEEVVGNLLNQKKATVAVAESCTGGLVSHWLTNVPGSSDYFLFSGVTYSNQAKIDVLGVSSETLKEFGAVHEETAKEMADRVRRISGATYGLSTSGIAGPGGGTSEKPVGTICVGLATPSAVEGHWFGFPFKRRSRNKQIFAMTALDLLRRELMNDDS